MKLILDPKKSALQNAAFYHEEAKRCRAKAEGAEKAILQTLSEMKKQEAVRSAVSAKSKREWFENFHYVRTSSGTLVIGGRNAKQNDLIYSKHLAPLDWFFHAEIRGAPAVVVKNASATEGELLEAAQFAASYSSAWKREFGSVDVYAIRGSQVSKHFQGGYLEQGAFAIAGERKWFKNTLLGLRVCLDVATLRFFVKPLLAEPTGFCVKILPGKLDKESTAKKIKTFFAKKLFSQGIKAKLDQDEIAKLLPGCCAEIEGS